MNDSGAFLNLMQLYSFLWMSDQVSPLSLLICNALVHNTQMLTIVLEYLFHYPLLTLEAYEGIGPQAM